MSQTLYVKTVFSWVYLCLTFLWCDLQTKLILCYFTLRYIMLYYVTLCYVVLCYITLCYVMCYQTLNLLNLSLTSKKYSKTLKMRPPHWVYRKQVLIAKWSYKVYKVEILSKTRKLVCENVVLKTRCYFRVVFKVKFYN